MTAPAEANVAAPVLSAEERAVESGRQKARERLKRCPVTVEQLRVVRMLLADLPRQSGAGAWVRGLPDEPPDP